MREVVCNVKINGTRFNGAVSVSVQGLMIRKKGLIRSQLKYFIPYSSILSINLSKKLFNFRLKIVFHHGISIDEIYIEGDSRLMEVYESIKRMRLNSAF
ncbi:MAG TPA: hypothetical protein EYH44_03365 [Thermoprotei archaeon]|nr:hypothetical protein [Thermoprotei archaeon]